MIDLLMQTRLLNIGLDIFSFLCLFIMFTGSIRNMSQTYDVVLFSRVKVCFMAAAMADMFSWIFNGEPGLMARTGLYAANMIFLFAECLGLAMWFMYVRYRLTGNTASRKQYVIFCVSFIALAAVLFTTPINGIFFTVSEDNIYARTAWTDVMSVVQILMMLYASFSCLRQRDKEQLPERRKECDTLASFIFPLLIGGLIQFFEFGLNLIIPCGTMSIMSVDMTLMGQKILQDPLTGLNNRGALDRHILTIEQDVRRFSEPIGVMMMDIDNFKGINDACGHAAGDKALVLFANTLRISCMNTGVFICRYGGDEFAIVARNTKEAKLNTIKKNLLKNLDEVNLNNTRGYELHTSVGCVYLEKMHGAKVKDLLKEADRQLYEQKKARDEYPAING